MARLDDKADEEMIAGGIPVQELPTPEELISRTADSLREDEGTDVALLDILSETIMTMNLADTAVADAMKAIEGLAVERAETSEDDKSGND